MKIFVLGFLLIFFKLVNSAELKIESFGKDQYDIYEVSDSRKFFGWSSDGVWLTNIGTNGSVKGKGILEIINGISSSNIMTKWTEVKGDYFYAQFFVKRGSVNQDATVQTFEIVSGTGRWEELVGQKCIGAYTPLVDSKFMWQGKCEMSDKTLERVKNYIKPE